MSKLKAVNGEIYAVSQSTIETLNVTFKKKAISPNGDIGEVRISVGGPEVIISFAQALSLAGEIMRRCG